jgi:hypothetical protein
MKLRKIEEGTLELILQKYANKFSLPKLDMTVISGTVVQELTIELRNFIIQRSTKSSFAKATLVRLILATMVICVHLLIRRKKSLLIFCINSLLIIKKINTQQISICFILRLFGAHIQMPSIQEMLVCMLIIGKILEENLIFLIMSENNALYGRQNILSKHMLTAAKMSIDANFHMDGRNKNIILWITKYMLADKLLNVQNLTVHIIIVNKIEDSQLVPNLDCSLEIEEALLEEVIMPSINYINQFSLAFYLIRRYKIQDSNKQFMVVARNQFQLSIQR